MSEYFGAVATRARRVTDGMFLAAAHALAAQSPATTDPSAPLLPALTGLRQAAVNMLAAVAPDDPRAKAAALQALNDSSPFVRREAIQALISIKGLSAAV